MTAIQEGPRTVDTEGREAADGPHFVPVASDTDGDGLTFFDGAVLKLLCGVSGCG